MRIVRRISSIILGFVLFIAGVFKLMDPVGTGLLMDEYFTFFHLGFLRFASNVFGSAFVLIETCAGIALITGVWRKIVAFVTLGLLGFFTLITAILAIFDPPMSCGCFGEVIHLTHIQSLVKNIVLLALWCLAFLPLKSIGATRNVKYVSFSISVGSVCLFLLYSSLSIPVMDFTDYSPGTELATWEEADWTTGEIPVMLSFSDAQGEYVDTLALEGRVIAVSVYEPGRLSAHRWEKIAGLTNQAAEYGFIPIVLAASTPELIAGEAPEELLPYIYFADRKTLMTLNRSNGGSCFLADGQIVAKWSSMGTPDGDKLSELAGQDPIMSLASETQSRKLKFQAFLLYVCAVMLLL